MNFFDLAKRSSKEDWKSLLDSGENPNTLDGYGQSPLALLVKLGNVDLFAFALQNGSDPFFPHLPSSSVFHSLLSDSKTEFLEIMIQENAFWRESNFFKTKDRDGNLVFHLAVHENYSDLFFFCIPILEANPELLLIKNEEGRVLLLEAMLFANWEDAETLLSLNLRQKIEGAQVKRKELLTHPFYLDKDGRNILHLLAENNKHLELKKLIIFFKEDGLDLNLADLDGNTALHLAANEDSTECLEVLLQNQADPFLKNKKGLSVAQILDREKFSHSLKTWKKSVITRFQEDKNFQIEVETWMKQEKCFPFSENEIAKTNLEFLKYR